MWSSAKRLTTGVFKDIFQWKQLITKRWSKKKNEPLVPRGGDVFRLLEILTAEVFWSLWIKQFLIQEMLWSHKRLYREAASSLRSIRAACRMVKQLQKPPPPPTSLSSEAGGMRLLISVTFWNQHSHPLHTAIVQLWRWESSLYFSLERSSVILTQRNMKVLQERLLSPYLSPSSLRWLAFHFTFDCGCLEQLWGRSSTNQSRFDLLLHMPKCPWARCWSLPQMVRPAPW